MAIGKPNNQNQRRKPNDYFTMNIQQYGENFLEFKNARDLEMESIRIFRGLARGQIDIDKYGHYFLDGQLLSSCIQAAFSKKIYFDISYTGVFKLHESIFASGDTPDPNILMVLDHHKKSSEAYKIILDGLNNIRATNNVNYLVCLVDSLSAFRNYV